MKVTINQDNYNAMCTGTRPGLRDEGHKRGLSELSEMRTLGNATKAACTAYDAKKHPNTDTGALRANSANKPKVDLNQRMWVHHDKSANAWIMTDGASSGAGSIPEKMARSAFRIYGDPVATFNTPKEACNEIKKHTSTGEGTNELGHANRATAEKCDKEGVTVGRSER